MPLANGAPHVGERGLQLQEAPTLFAHCSVGVEVFTRTTDAHSTLLLFLTDSGWVLHHSLQGVGSGLEEVDLAALFSHHTFPSSGFFWVWYLPALSMSGVAGS
jgi:hypothetical protein